MGDVQAVISSPPYQRTGVSDHQGQTDALKGGKFRGGGERFLDANYGTSPGQIGNDVGETYWQAMADIYAQCYQLLPIGCHMVLVLKAFVRQGRIVDLPGQTAQLLEHLGFRVLYMHRAMLTSQIGQLTLDGGEERKSRKSFFRRLSEAKGGPPIDWETVLCAVKE